MTTPRDQELQALRRQHQEDYATFTTEWRWRMDAQRSRVHAALKSGGTVIEHQPSGREHAWTIRDGGTGPFVPSVNTNPDYLTQHLMGRHEHWGWDHTIDGVRYHLGRAVVVLQLHEGRPA